MRNLNVTRNRSKLGGTASAAAHRQLVEFPELLAFPSARHEFSSVIFDFDGTLGDSMWVWDDIDTRFCEKYGVEIPEGLMDELAILGFEDTAEYFIEHLGVQMTVEEICMHFDELAADRYANEVQLWPGVRDYLDVLASRGVGLAIATALSWPLLELVLEHTGILDLFDDIAFCDESHNKEQPDVFLLAAERIGADPRDCLVFEDTVQGTRSARRAGMTACGIFDSRRTTPRASLEATSDFVIEDYCALASSARKQHPLDPRNCR